MAQDLQPRRQVAPQPPPLLGPGERPPFTVINRGGRARALLLCDHASPAIPACLGDLGLDAGARARHIAYDIGAAGVTLTLAKTLDAAAVLSSYSRLVIDLNRPLGSPTSIPPVSDGVTVPGNAGLGPAEATRRAEALHRPYHEAVAGEIARLSRRGGAPAIVSIHSCTPVMDGFERPWHIGVLWNRDPRIAVPLMGVLGREPAIVVGDNEPYSGRDGHGYTIEAHAGSAGLPSVLIEVRQDLVDTPRGVAEWAAVLHKALAEVLADDALYEIRHY